MHNIISDLSNHEYQLFARHFTLEQINIEGQKRLKNAKILFIGAGGLACPALLYLVASGIGKIGIVDNDILELSNLQRQIIYNTTQIGSLKTSSAEHVLRLLNPLCTIQIYNTRLNHLNAISIISNYDIIVDSTDNFMSRYIIAYNANCIKMV